MSHQADGAPVAIVTGAGRGLGREYALALARAGYAVVVNDLGGGSDGTGSDATPAARVVQEITALGSRAIADGSDVSDWNAAGRLIQKAIDTFGRLDGLVNNAGVLRDRTIANITEEDWDASIRVNLKGTAAPLHHAARYWRDSSKSTGAPVRAAVVNTTSASGLYFATGQGNYAAAKAGVASLSIVAARELERYGVRVNVIGPAAATRLTESVMGADLKARLDPSLVAPLVVYLLSPEARDVTGRVFEMGGGALAVVDMPRPVVARRASDSRWTVEQLAKTVPDLIRQLPRGMNVVDAMRFMMAGPTEA
jgi:NAD(P)-dependent dehydrogenase (short-subunit alcohol dehydrogenase family)